MTRKYMSVCLAVAVAISAALGVTALPAGASVVAASEGEAYVAEVASGYAQVTVDPNAPKRNFEEVEEKPWTLLMGKALVPLMIFLLVFVVIWYVWKMTRVRATRISES